MLYIKQILYALYQGTNIVVLALLITGCGGEYLENEKGDTSPNKEVTIPTTQEMIDLANSNGKKELANLLANLKNGETIKVDPIFITQAIKLGSQDVAKFLLERLEKDAVIDQPVDEKTNLMILRSAVDANMLPIVQLLLKKGVDPYKSHGEGKTPSFVEAIKKGYTEVALAIVENSDRSQLVKRFGETKTSPLERAIINKNELVALRIIDKLDKAQLDNNENSTKTAPLHTAVKKNMLEVVSALIKKDVNKNIKDKDGKTPIDYADNKEMEDLLK
jgi:ankyrin repeat protein